MRLALAQLSVGKDRNHNLSRVLEAMDQAKAQRAEIIAFPELAIDLFFPQRENDENAANCAEPIPGPSADAVAAKAKEHALVTVFNMYEQDDHGRRYDSSPVFDSDGTCLGVTRMVHICNYECFHEQAYYHAGDHGAPVYETSAGAIGVAICYDRHYPEYMRALGVAGAELVVIPQAGALDEWPDGLYEAEVRTAAFQNGYFAALCNRVGEEEKLTFAGESFVVDPRGQVISRGKRLEDDILITEIDLGECKTSPARTLFWRDRRPNLYCEWLR
jgi:N-carbamoylputrescine amidase